MSVREDLYAKIQELNLHDRDLEDTVLVGFMVIAEWRGPDGDTWISKVSGDHAASLPQWRERGYASEVLFDWWAGSPEEEGS